MPYAVHYYLCVAAVAALCPAAAAVHLRVRSFSSLAAAAAAAASPPRPRGWTPRSLSAWGGGDGHEWDVPASAERTPLENLRWAVQRYAALNDGATDVPADFVIGETREWDESLWGLKLGKAAAALRALEAAAVRRESRALRKTTASLHPNRGGSGGPQGGAESAWRLNLNLDDEDAAMFGLASSRANKMAAPSIMLSRTPWGRRLSESTGFTFDAAQVSNERHFELYFTALRTFVNETPYSNAILPRNWRVPKRRPYPPELCGVNLDRKMYCLDFYREFVVDYPERQRALRSLGFVWQRIQPEFNLIVEALVVYKSMCGDLRVPKNYVISRTDPRWPIGTRGMPLGRRVCQIRNRFDYVGYDAPKVAQLDRMGFIWDVASYRDRVLDEALETYAQLHDGARLPPARFVVPLDSDRWPKATRGLRLGDLAAKRQLKRGQNRPRDQAFQNILDALHIYKELFGHVRVPQKFVVPGSHGCLLNKSDDEDQDAPHDAAIGGGDDDDDNDNPSNSPWPRHLLGLPLGKRVCAMRSKGTFVGGTTDDKDALSDRDRARRAQLDALGFEWTLRRSSTRGVVHPPRRRNVKTTKNMTPPFRAPKPATPLIQPHARRAIIGE